MNRPRTSNVASGFSALIVSASLLLVAPAVWAQNAAPDFSLVATGLLHRRINLDAKKMSQRQWAGKEKGWVWQPVGELPKVPVLFVHLWSVTCAPCVKELPFLSDLIKKYRRLFGNKVDYLIMSYDEQSEMDTFLAKLGNDASLNIYQFKKEEVEASLGTMMLPMTLLVERNGLVVRQAFVGTIDTRQAEVNPSLTRLVELVGSQSTPSKK